MYQEQVGQQINIIFHRYWQLGVWIWTKNVYDNFNKTNKCLRHLLNRIQSKNDTIRIFEINKLSLSCFGDKIYILNNATDVLAIGY